MADTRPELTVVLDSVIRMREEQLWPHPDVLEFATAAEAAGAHGVLMSLHIGHIAVRDRDWRLLGGLRRAQVCLAAAPDTPSLPTVAQSGASRCVLIPGTRHQHSSGGALAVSVVREALTRIAQDFSGTGIELAARIDPSVAAVNVCAETGLDAVEVNTAAYALASRPESIKRRLEELAACVSAAHSSGLRVSVRGGLDFENVPALTRLHQISEIRIGQALLARALLDGIAASVGRMRAVLGE